MAFARRPGFLRGRVPDRGMNGRALEHIADRAKASPAWRYREIATGHMIASNRPDDLARLLLELT